MPPKTHRGRHHGHSQPPQRRIHHDNVPTEPQAPVIPPQAYVQAYEAQLIYGQQDRARALYAIPGASAESSTGRRGGSALMRWEGDEERDVWVDRYDILHLVSSLPDPPEGVAGASSSTRDASPAPTSSSWDSIPSDAEDTWYLSSDGEYEEYERSKKRRWMEALREERLREREKEDTDKVKADMGQEGWQGDDEEPSPAIRTLMTHTAQSLSKSPNPSLLEMRILANHSTDERFAFLRGRWKNTWTSIRDRHIPKPNSKPTALLGGYDSDSDGSDLGGSESARPPDDSPPPPPPPDSPK